MKMTYRLFVAIFILGLTACGAQDGSLKAAADEGLCADSVVNLFNLIENQGRLSLRSQNLPALKNTLNYCALLKADVGTESCAVSTANRKNAYTVSYAAVDPICVEVKANLDVIQAAEAQKVKAERQQLEDSIPLVNQKVLFAQIQNEQTWQKLINGLTKTYGNIPRTIPLIIRYGKISEPLEINIDNQDLFDPHCRVKVSPLALDRPANQNSKVLQFDLVYLGSGTDLEISGRDYFISCALTHSDYKIRPWTLGILRDIFRGVVEFEITAP